MDNEIAFKRRVEVKEALRFKDSVEQIWDGLRQCMVKEAEAVCGRSKGPPRHRKTWWWNDEIGEQVERKRRLFFMRKNSEPEKEKNEEAYRKANKQDHIYTQSTVGRSGEWGTLHPPKNEPLQNVFT